jgi:hypothetical protein
MSHPRIEPKRCWGCQVRRPNRRGRKCLTCKQTLGSSSVACRVRCNLRGCGAGAGAYHHTNCACTARPVLCSYHARCIVCKRKTALVPIPLPRCHVGDHTLRGTAGLAMTCFPKHSSRIEAHFLLASPLVRMRRCAQCNLPTCFDHLWRCNTCSRKLCPDHRGRKLWTIAAREGKGTGKKEGEGDDKAQRKRESLACRHCEALFFTLPITQSGCCLALVSIILDYL